MRALLGVLALELQQRADTKKWKCLHISCKVSCDKTPQHTQIALKATMAHNLLPIFTPVPKRIPVSINAWQEGVSHFMVVCVWEDVLCWSFRILWVGSKNKDKSGENLHLADVKSCFYLRVADMTTTSNNALNQTLSEASPEAEREIWLLNSGL